MPVNQYPAMTICWRVIDKLRGLNSAWIFTANWNKVQICIR